MVGSRPAIIDPDTHRHAALCPCSRCLAIVAGWQPSRGHSDYGVSDAPFTAKLRSNRSAYNRARYKHTRRRLTA